MQNEILALLLASALQIHPVDQKIYELCKNETTRELRAVQNRAFIQVPFSASTLGVRIGALALNLAEAFAALVRGEDLPSLQFTPTSIADDGTESSPQVLGMSGARVYSKLPMWNGTDLDTFCPGSNKDIQIRDDIPLRTIEEAEVEIQQLEDQVTKAQKDAEKKEEKIEELEEEVERLGEMMVGIQGEEEEDLTDSGVSRGVRTVAAVVAAGIAVLV